MSSISHHPPNRGVGANSEKEKGMKMGEWYKIRAKAEKMHRSSFANRDDAFPYDVNWAACDFDPPIEAMYIGVRNVYEGNWEWTSGIIDQEQYFYRKVTHRVFLFVVNEHHNPIYVFPDDIIEPVF
jgi:hypothetical protein